MKQDIKVTVDAVIFTERAGVRHVLLVQRKNPPFKGEWALPGGFVEEDEDLETACRRELKEETRIDAEDLKQLGAFGKIGRDPRGRTISVAYVGIVAYQMAKAASDAAAVEWHPLDGLPTLAFDHNEILSQALLP
ncbi:MAG TPA: NUDIX hydrolase [Cryomorphaceae bacterium]|nr:NUDIX hydrolase [Cryomorphaceae bacterium]